MATHITKEELWKKLQRGEDFLLLEIQPPEKYEQLHLPAAVNAPLEQIDELAQKWEKSQPIVVYCGSYT